MEGKPDIAKVLNSNQSINPLHYSQNLHECPQKISNKVRISRIVAVTLIIISTVATLATLLGIVLEKKIDKSLLLESYILRKDIVTREDIRFNVIFSADNKLRYVRIPSNKAYTGMEYLQDFNKSCVAYRDYSTHWCLIKKTPPLVAPPLPIGANNVTLKKSPKYTLMKISSDTISKEQLQNLAGFYITQFCQNWPIHTLIEETNQRRKRQNPVFVAPPPPIIIVQKPSTSPSFQPSAAPPPPSSSPFSVLPFPPPTPLSFSDFVKLISGGTVSPIPPPPPPNSPTTVSTLSPTPAPPPATIIPPSYCEFNCTSANSTQPDSTGTPTVSTFDLCDTKCQNYFSSAK